MNRTEKEIDYVSLAIIIALIVSSNSDDLVDGLFYLITIGPVLYFIVGLMFENIWEEIKDFFKCITGRGYK